MTDHSISDSPNSRLHAAAQADPGSRPGQALDLAECTRYLDTLYPDQDALPPGYYVASWPVTGSGARMHSKWFTASQRQALIRFLVEEGREKNIYLALGFRSDRSKAEYYRRGTTDDVVSIPGVWVELDHNRGRHAARGLPDPQTLLQWMGTLPWRWSLIIDSTGGYQAICSLRNPGSSPPMPRRSAPLPARSSPASRPPSKRWRLPTGPLIPRRIYRGCCGHRAPTTTKPAPPGG